MKRTCNRDHRKKFPHGSTKSRHLLFHLPKSLTLSLSSNHAIPRCGAPDLLQSREHLLHLRSTASSESPSRAQRGATSSPLPLSADQRAPPPSPRLPAIATAWPATTRCRSGTGACRLGPLLPAYPADVDASLLPRRGRRLPRPRAWSHLRRVFVLRRPTFYHGGS